MSTNGEIVSALMGVGSFLVVIIAFFIALYVFSALVFVKLGKKAGISWSWVSWIPGGYLFVQAKVIKWDVFWLFPVLYLLSDFISTFPIIGLLLGLVIIVFSFIQAGQLFQAFGKSFAIVFWNFLPIIGTIIFYVKLYEMLSPKYEYRAVEHTWYGSIKS